MREVGRGAHAPAREPAGQRGRSSNARRSAPQARLRWAVLALVPPVLCFLLSSFYVGRWLREADVATLSISTNGGPGVVHLAAEQEDIRRIERRAMLSRPETFSEDRSAIAAWKSDLAVADAAYRETPNYPGEREMYQAMVSDRARFFSAVDGVLASLEDGRLSDAAAMRATVLESADTLTASISRLIQLNADQVQIAGSTLAVLRRRLWWLTNARDALAFLFVIAGTLLGLRSARSEAVFAAERRLLDQRRMEDLDSFAGWVAHDLRDLLGVLLMRASLGERARTAEGCREALGQVVRQAQRMSEIIDALLRFARAAGRPDPNASCDLAAVVGQVVAEVRPLAGEAGVALTVEPLHPVVVACDATVLSLVVSNLVRNAIKYIDDVGVKRITLRAHKVGRCLRVEVEDTGPGLPPGAEAQVFEPFVRLGETRGKPGIGLGLATVRRLVEANEGEVGVISRPGQGCCFWFTLLVRQGVSPSENGARSP